MLLKLFVTKHHIKKREIKLNKNYVATWNYNGISVRTAINAPTIQGAANKFKWLHPKINAEITRGKLKEYQVKKTTNNPRDEISPVLSAIISRDINTSKGGG